MNKFDIGDDEIRIIGSRKRETTEHDVKVPTPEPMPQKPHGHLRFTVIAAILLLLGICLFLALRSNGSKDKEEPATESPAEADTCQVESVVTIEEEAPTSVAPASLVVSDTTVNDIALRRFTVHSAKASLVMAPLPKNNPDILLATQAADVRSDKDLPAGTFVLNGELIAKSHSKYGFCAIIGQEITLGRQMETPFLERAIEQGGSFFRQYSLVSDGQMVAIPPKGKALRRSLCLLHGNICVIESLDRESYHDFSQALVDMGVSEAISLVGGSAILLYRDAEGEVVSEGYLPSKRTKSKASENYIVFTKK